MYFMNLTFWLHRNRKWIHTHIKCRMSLYFTEYIIDVWNNVNKTHLMNLKMKYSCDTIFWYRPMQEDLSHYKYVHSRMCCKEWTDKWHRQKLQYFPAHKTHRDFFVRNFRKNNDKWILILAIYWKKTGLLHAKISNHNIIYSS